MIRHARRYRKKLVEFFGQAAGEGVWEGYELSDDVPRWPAARIALDRTWREPTTVRLEWGGTAIRGEDYLAPHPRYGSQNDGHPHLRLLTTGDPEEVSRIAHVFLPDAPAFECGVV